MSSSGSKLVTIATYDSSLQANLSKSKLESEGIFVFLQDENTVVMNWFYSNAIGGIKLKVRAEDAKRALGLLKEEAIDLAEQTGDISWSAVRCPQCDSRSVQHQRFSIKMALLSVLLLGFPLLWAKRGWLCLSCGWQWKNEDRER